MRAGRLGVIVLAGGRSRRMGADKAQVRLNGVRLVDALLESLPASSPHVVVSPFDLGIPTVSETPPFGGPVAGIAAGLAHLETELVGVLAVDAPFSAQLLPNLVSVLDAQCAQVAVVEAADGFIQPLCAVWRRDALESALSQVGARDVAVKRLLHAAERVAFLHGDGSERDYDTAAELAQLGTIELER